jgi:hypothetical protein
MHRALAVSDDQDCAPPKSRDDDAFDAWDYGFAFPDGEPDGSLSQCPIDLAIALQIDPHAMSLVEWQEADMQWWAEINLLVSSYHNGQRARKESRAQK